MLVTEFRYWWHLLVVGARSLCWRRYRDPVTKTAKTVINISKLLPTHLVSNIRHQHRCSRFIGMHWCWWQIWENSECQTQRQKRRVWHLWLFFTLVNINNIMDINNIWKWSPTFMQQHHCCPLFILSRSTSPLLHLDAIEKKKVITSPIFISVNQITISIWSYLSKIFIFKKEKKFKKKIKIIIGFYRIQTRRRHFIEHFIELDRWDIKRVEYWKAKLSYWLIYFGWIVITREL